MIIGNQRLTPSVNVTQKSDGSQTRVYFNAALIKSAGFARCKRVSVEKLGQKVIFGFTRSAASDGFSLFREGKTDGLTFCIATSKVPFLAVGQYKPRLVKTSDAITIDCRKVHSR